jgi:hypothetical protein
MFTRSFLGRFVLSVAILLAGGMALQAAEVRVNVKGLDGKPANGVEVRIEGGGKGVKLSGKTDQKGQHVFKNLAAGTYRMTVLAAKPVSLAPVLARSEGPVRVEFDLKAIAAGKRPRQWAQTSEIVMGSNFSGVRWVEVDENGRLGADAAAKVYSGKYQSQANPDRARRGR